MRPFIFTKRCFVCFFRAFIAFSAISAGLIFALKGLSGVIERSGNPASLGPFLYSFFICLTMYSGLALAAPLTIPLGYILAVPALLSCELFGTSRGVASKTSFILAGALVGLSVFVFGGTAFFCLLIGLSGGAARASAFEGLVSLGPAQLALFSSPMLIAGCVGGYHAWKSGLTPATSPLLN